jgi:DNA repair protein RecO (recombination protein O)
VSVEAGHGVILRTRSLTETSLIIHWLSAEHGRIATVARGARRPKSPFRGRLDVFYEAQFTFQRSRRSDLHALREVVVTNSHPWLRTRIGLLQQAAYATALIEAAAETETPVPELHELLCGFLACLGPSPPTPQLLWAFELKLLAASGLSPDLDESPLSPRSRDLAQSLAVEPLAALGRAELRVERADELDRFLQRFLAWHLDRVPRGRAEAFEAAASHLPAAGPLAE